MPYQDSANKNGIRHTGEYGNTVTYHDTVTLAAAAIADRSRLMKVSAGTKITDAKLIVAALGADTTISLGLEPCDGTATSDAALIAATSTVAAGVIRQTTAPVTVTRDSYVVAVVGGAEATGLIDAVVTGEYMGH